MNKVDLELTKAMIRRHEGLMLTPYRCPTGHVSIGYGHNLEAHNEPVPSSITNEQAEEYLDRDLTDVLHDLWTNLTPWEGNELNGPRQAVLVDMCFNMGIGALLKFKKMLEAVKIGDYSVASIEILSSLYAKQVGRRASELAAMMMTGKWGAQQ